MSSCPTCAVVDLLVSGSLAGAILLGCASAWLRDQRRGWAGPPAPRRD